MKAPRQQLSDATKSGSRQPFLQRKPGAAERPFITNPSAPQIQPKLTVNQPGDRYEQEADRMAERVMRMPSENETPPMISRMRAGGPLQRKCAACEQEDKENQMVQRQAASSDPTHASDAVTQRLTQRKGRGNALPPALHDQMGQAFQSDFSDVRLHTDAEAAQMSDELNAQAFTHGSDIYFNAGKYQPGTAEGRGLLGHELTHTVQQGGGAFNRIQRQPETWWRGEATGVAPAKKGGQIHDFGDGLYFSNDPNVAHQYAKLRAGNRPGTEKIFSVTFDRALLGRVLDLTTDARWLNFMQTRLTANSPTNEQLIKMVNENYWHFFKTFLRQNNLKIENFDAVIGPEYVRGGIQVCIRNEKIAEQVKAGVVGVPPNILQDVKYRPVIARIQNLLEIERITQTYRRLWEARGLNPVEVDKLLQSIALSVSSLKGEMKRDSCATRPEERGKFEKTIAEKNLSPELIEAIKSSDKTPKKNLEERIAFERAIFLGKYDSRAFQYMLSQIDPLTRDSILAGERGQLTNRTFQRIRTQFFTSALASPSRMASAAHLNAGKRALAKGTMGILLAIDAINWGNQFSNSMKSHEIVNQRKNLAPFAQRILFWQQLGVKPNIVGVDDDYWQWSPNYYYDYDKVVQGINGGGWFEAVYIRHNPDKGVYAISDADWLRFGTVLTQNVRNLDEFYELFVDSGQDAVTWENKQGGWENAIWKIRVGYYGTGGWGGIGKNEVEERWEEIPILTMIMNLFVKRIISNTEKILELQQEGKAPEENEAIAEIGGFNSPGQPQYKALLKKSQQTTKVKSEYYEERPGQGCDANYNLYRHIKWWSPPVFYVYEIKDGMARVGGADYNTYAILRGRDAYAIFCDNQLYMPTKPHRAVKDANFHGTVYIPVSELNIFSFGESDLAIGQIAKIHRVWVDHNVKQDGQHGMMIHASFDLENLWGQTCQISAYFYTEDGTPLKDINGHFMSSNGEITVGEKFIPFYPKETYGDFFMFMPNSELHIENAGTGRYDLKFRLEINPVHEREIDTDSWFYSPTVQIFGKSLALSDFYHFTYTIGTQ